MTKSRQETGFQWATASDRLIRSLFLATAAFSLYLIWFRLNYAQVDIAGHIVSGAAFRAGLYHRFNDQFFLGYIHGLFYPPLEDVLMGGLNLVVPDPILGFRIYLTLLVSGFLGAALLLGYAFKSVRARNLWLISFLFIFYADKPQLDYQGLSLVDLIQTGLSGEFLGATFMLLLARELLGRRRRYWILSLLLFLATVSHIVIALACVILMILWCFKFREREIAYCVFLALGSAGFFLVPFIAYRSYLTSANIFGLSEPSMLGVALAGTAFSFGHRRASVFLGIAAFFLFFPVFGPWINLHVLQLPVFHYYRLGIIALFFIVIGASVFLEDAHKDDRQAASILALCLIAVLGCSLRPRAFAVKDPELTPTRLDTADPDRLSNSLNPPGYGRFWVAGPQRSVDFGLDELLALKFGGFRSTKGLYWESSRNNTLLSSYLATLLAPPVVLDDFHYMVKDCAVAACILDHHFRDHNVKGWIVGNLSSISGVGAAKSACYDDILAHGETSHFRLTEHDSGIVLDKRAFRTFWVTPKGSMSNGAIETIDPASLKLIDRGNRRHYAAPIWDITHACLTGRVSDHAYADAATLAAIHHALSGIEPLPPLKAAAEIVSLGRGKFDLNLGWEAPRLFRIKLSFFPGVELRNDAGELMPIFDGFPHIFAIGNSHMTLEYRQPAAIKVGYAVSAVFAILALCLGYRGWRQSPRQVIILP